MKDFIKKWHLFGSDCYKFSNKKKIEVIIWGTGKFARGLISSNKFLKVKFFIDSRTKQILNKKINNIPIKNINNILNICKYTPILIATSYSKIAHKTLISKGYKNIYCLNQFSPRWIVANLPKKLLSKIDKFFLDHKIFYKKLELNNSFTSKKYFYLKNNVSFNKLDKIFYEIFNLKKNYNKGSKQLAVFILEKSPEFFNEIPVLPDFLKNSLSKKIFKKNFNSFELFNNYLLFFWDPIISINDKRLKFLLKSQKFNNIPKTKIIKNFLKSKEGPTIDFARKWLSHNKKNIFYKNLPIKLKKNNLGVFFLRGWFRNKKLVLNFILNIIKKSKLTIILSRKLFKLEVKNVAAYTRGGYWRDSKNIKDGLPYWIVVFSFSPKINIQSIKENIRNICSDYNKVEINSVHSSDDSLEALDYLKFIKDKKLNFDINKLYNF